MFHNEAAKQGIQLSKDTEIPREVVLFLNPLLIEDRNLSVEIFKSYSTVVGSSNQRKQQTRARDKPQKMNKIAEAFKILSGTI